ncbi:MAG: hypothetical protein ACLP81_03095 [Acidimicrobiales bacterium]
MARPLRAAPAQAAPSPLALMAVHWKCSICGGGPQLLHRGSHEGWVRFDVSVVRNDVPVRVDLSTCCSVDCVLEYLARQEFAARAALAQDADIARKVDEIEEETEDPGPD